MRFERTSQNARRSRAIAVAPHLFAVFLASASPALAGVELSGPIDLEPLERATYRIVVAGDEVVDACDITLELDIPRRFLVLGTNPDARFPTRDASTLVFDRKSRLVAGDEMAVAIELMAPATPVDSALCATLSYSACGDDITERLESEPVCTPVGVATSIPDDALQALSIVPCGTTPIVDVGGQTHEPTQWDDARSVDLGTSPRSTLRAKTSGNNLYVSIEVFDETVDASDDLILYVDTDSSGGPPTGVDRAFRITRTAAALTHGGTGTGFDLALASSSLQWELVDDGASWIAEIEVSLVDLGGPIDLQAVRLGVLVTDGASSSTWPAGLSSSDTTTMAPSVLSLCAVGDCSFTTWAQRPDALDNAATSDPQNLYDDVHGPNATYAGFPTNGAAVRVTGFENFGSTGTVIASDLLLGVNLVSPIAQPFSLEIYRNGARDVRTALTPATLNAFVGNPGVLVVDVTTAGFRVADYAAGQDLDVRLAAGSDGSAVQLDAIGFRVTVDQICATRAATPDLDVHNDNGFVSLLAGQLFDYTIQYRNQGTATATGVVLIDTLSANTRYRSGRVGFTVPPASTGTVEYSTNGGPWTTAEPVDGTAGVRVRLHVDILPAAPLELYRFTVGARVFFATPRGDIVTNQVVASCAQLDADPSNNSDWDDGPTPGDDAGDPVADQALPAITIPCILTPASVDGIIASGEYDGATVLSANRIGTDPLQGAFLHAYHDLGNLYIAGDVDDTNYQANDGIHLVIDSDLDQIDPDVDDRHYRLRRSANTRFELGIGTNTDGDNWQNGFPSAATTALTTSASGWIGEMNIPLSEIPGITGDDDQIGFGFLNEDVSRPWANFPEFAQLNDASSWSVATLARCWPRADFVAVDGCAGDSIQFTDMSTSNPTSWTWDFGDGTTDTSQNPLHTYATPGGYLVTLTACNAVNCDPIQRLVTVQPIPTPLFFVDPPAPQCIVSGQDTVLNLDGTLSRVAPGATIADPGGYVWASTLGSLGGTLSPSDTLTIPAGLAGPFSVSLTMTDSRGCIATANVNLQLFLPPDSRPTATPVCGHPIDSSDIPLDATASVIAAGATATQWNWSVPIGAIVGTGPTPILRVPGGIFGSFAVDLEVVDSNGCAHTSGLTAEVHQPPTAALQTPPARCTDDVGGLTIALDASPTSPGSSPLDGTGFLWTATAGTLVGGTATETLSLPPGFVGTVDACVAAGDLNGCRADQVCTVVEVIDRPRPQFNYTIPPRVVGQPLVIPIDASATTWIAPLDESDFTWTSSEGTISPTGRTPILTLSPTFSGPVTVTLTVAGEPAPCARSAVELLEILAPPVAVIAPIADRCAVPGGTNIILDGTGSSSTNGITDPTGYRWTAWPVGILLPSNGATTLLSIPTGNGSVNVRLDITDDAALTDFTITSFMVFPVPIADFTVDAAARCDTAGQGASFLLDASTSIVATFPATYSWVANPPGVATVTNLSPDGQQARLDVVAGYYGTINVELTVDDPNACTSRISRDVWTSPGPTAVLTGDIDELCSEPTHGMVITLDATGSSSPTTIANPGGYAWSTTAGTLSPSIGSTNTLVLPAGYVGTAVVTVTVFDDDSCASSTTHEVTVHGRPVASLIPDVPLHCDSTAQGASFNLDATGSTTMAPPLSYIWSATPPPPAVTVTGTTPGSALMVVAPGTTGVFMASLTVVDQNGCVDATNTPVTVTEGPTVVAAPTSLSMCSPLVDTTVALDASASSSGVGIDDPSGYLWTSAFALSSSSGSTTTVTVPAAHVGAVAATVQVTDRDGCAETDMVSLDIRALPTPRITGSVGVCSSDGEVTVSLDATGSTAPLPIPNPTGYAWSTSIGTVTPDNGSSTSLVVPASYDGPVVVTLTVTDDSGCSATMTHIVDVYERPNLVTAATPDRACDTVAGASFAFDASPSTTSAAPLTFAWTTAPPASVSTASGPTTVLSIPAGVIGGASVTVVATDANGCQATAVLPVQVDPLPVVSIATPSTTGCTPAGSSVEFFLDGGNSSVAAPDSIATWSWSVDPPGTMPPFSTPTTTVTFPPGTPVGTYVARLDVTSTSGCRASAQVDLEVKNTPPPTALVAAPTAVCADLSLETVIPLDGSASSSVAPATLSDPGSFDWSTSLGSLDGSTGSGEVLRVPPGTTGVASVLLLITDSNGCTNQVESTIAIVAPPIAVAEGTPLLQCEDPGGNRIELDGLHSTTTHPFNATLAYLWSTSEGTLSSPTAAQPHIDVPAIGTARDVTATLQVSDASGCVSAPATVVAHIDPAPLAAFTASTAAAGANITFDASSSASGSPPLSYDWSFGDGTTSSGTVVANHTFAAPGVYTVQLTVADATDCTHTTSRRVEIAARLEASLTEVSACVGTSLELNALVTGGLAPYSFSWILGDGSSATGTAPVHSHSYTVAGGYTPTLTVTDAAGSSVTAATAATVFALPSYTASTLGPAVVGVPQTFTAATVDAAVTFVWTFADGSTQTGADVEHTFLTPGTSTVNVLAKTADGCESATDVIVDVVLPTPTTMTLTKSASTAVADPGDRVEYALVVGNGAGDARDITIEDRLPDGFRYVPGSLRRDSAAMSEPVGFVSLTFPAFDLAPTTSTVIRYEAVIDPEIRSGTFRNEARLSAVAAGGQTIEVGPRSATIVVTESPDEKPVDLWIVKSADADPHTVEPGSLVRYRIDYNNRGPANATEVVITDDFPSHLASVDSNDDDGRVIGSRIVWSVGDVAAGASGSVQYALRLADGLVDGTPVRNVVIVTSKEPDTNPDDNRDSVEIAVGGSPDLAITKSVQTAPDPAVAGATATYTLSWRNAGIGVARSVVIVDDYDESKLELVELPSSATDSGGVLTIDVGDVPPGGSGSATYTATVRDDADGAVTNVATIRSSLADPTPEDNTASARFDIVKVPAELQMTMSALPRRGCDEPQVLVALRSDQYDTAGAMHAATVFLDAADRLADDPAPGHDIHSVTRHSVLENRLRTFARINVEALLLHSGMGLPWAPTDRTDRLHALGFGQDAAADPSVFPGAPITIPLATAHPVAEVQRDLDEPWCRHELHHHTTSVVIGRSLQAMSAYAADALDDGDPAVRQRARLVLALAGDVVAELSSWRNGALEGSPAPIPATITLATDDNGVIVPRASGPTPDVFGTAAMVGGLARLVDVTSRHSGAAPRALEASTRDLLATLLDDLVDQIDPAEGPDLQAAATIAAVIDDLKRLGGTPPAILEQAVAAALAADRQQIASAPQALALDNAVTAIRLALATGDGSAAIELWQRLDAQLFDARLGVYTIDQTRRAITYTPTRLAAFIDTLTLLHGARHTDASAAVRSSTTPGLILERIASSIERIVVQAGLQVDLANRQRDASASSVILSADGDVRIDPRTRRGEHTLAPVLVAAVSLVDDGSLDPLAEDNARTLFEASAGIRQLSTSAAQCRTAQASLVDRRFVTETGLFATEGIERAALALADEGIRTDNPLLAQVAHELSATAFSNRATLGFLAAMGVRLDQAEGLGGPVAARQLIEGYARSAGLSSVPATLPTWLELGAGDPSFPAPLDATSAYAIGWDPSSFDSTLTTAALGQSLLADVRLVEQALARGTDLDGYIARVRLHAATLKVELIASLLDRSGEVADLTPVMDSSGRVLRVEEDKQTALRGHASLVVGLDAYAELVRTSPALDDGPPVAPERARKAADELRRKVSRTVDRGRVDDPLGLLYALRAAHGENHSPDVQAAARALADATPSAEVSPLALAAILLEAAIDVGDDDAIGRRFRALREFYDRDWKLFRSRRSDDENSSTDDSFILTDVDLGAVLSGLAAALPALHHSEREQATELLLAAARMLDDLGLEQKHHVTLNDGDVTVVTTAPQIARAVQVTVQQREATTALHPFDRIEVVHQVDNPVPSSRADDVVVSVELGEAFRYVQGSVTPATAAAQASDSTVSFRLGKVGGEQTVELRYELMVTADARTATQQIRSHAEGRSASGPDTAGLRTADSVSSVAVQGYGSLAGHVFVDVDGNGHRTDNEPGIARISVRIDDGSSVVTDDHGRYELPRVLPGTYHARVFEPSLPVGLSVRETDSARVDVSADIENQLDFALSSASIVTGIVYRDDNGNRRMDSDERPVAGVVVETGNGSRSITDAMGRYLIRGVTTGWHELQVARRQPFLKDRNDLRLRPLALP